VLLPDIAQRPASTPAKPPGDHTPFGGLVRKGNRIGQSMNRSDEQSGLRAPSDLAERFRELQWLRKQVQDLEQCATQNSQAGKLRGTENETRRRK